MEASRIRHARVSTERVLSETRYLLILPRLRSPYFQPSTDQPHLYPPMSLPIFTASPRRNAGDGLHHSHDHEPVSISHVYA